jgi:hypothetical protein
MTIARDFVNRHPVATYFVLTLAIAWGGILVVAGADGIPATAEEFERLFPFVVLALLAGPSLAGLLWPASPTDRPHAASY